MDTRGAGAGSFTSPTEGGRSQPRSSGSTDSPRLLMDVLGIPDELARSEADRWGHVMSDDVASRIAALLADSANRVPAVPAQAHAGHGGTASARALDPREEDSPWTVR